MVLMLPFSDHPILRRVSLLFLYLIFSYMLTLEKHTRFIFVNEFFILCCLCDPLRGSGACVAWRRTEDVSAMPLLSPLPLAFCLPQVGSQWIIGEQHGLFASSESWCGQCLLPGPPNSLAAHPTLLGADRVSWHIAFISGNLS